LLLKLELKGIFMSEIVIANKSYSPNEIIEHSNKAAQWFLIIAGFSLINSVMVYLGAEVNFVVGLGVTMFVDALLLATQGDLAGIAQMVFQTIGIGFNVGVLGIFYLIWKKSKQGGHLAYIIGTVLYLLDGLLFLLIGDWVGIAFHVFFLFFIVTGYAFIKNHTAAQELLAKPKDQESEAAIAKQFG
jgi:hypothetical protein